MVQARRKPGVLQRGNGTISSSRLRKIPSSATDSRWITVGNPLPAQTPKRRNSERGSENVIFQQPARDQTVTKSVGRAELCHPILAQQFRLGKDRERRLLLLIRWISVRTQDAFDDRAHLSTNALLDDWKNKNPFHRNGWTPVVSVTVGTRLQAPLRGNPRPRRSLEQSRHLSQCILSNYRYTELGGTLGRVDSHPRHKASADQPSASVGHGDQ